MLDQAARLTRKRFLTTSAKSQQSSCRYFVCKWRRSDTPTGRFAVVVSQNICALAVDRNRKRRQTYEAIRVLQQKKTAPIHAIFYAKKSLATATFTQIEQDLASLFQQLSRS